MPIILIYIFKACLYYTNSFLVNYLKLFVFAYTTLLTYIYYTAIYIVLLKLYLKKIRKNYIL